MLPTVNPTPRRHRLHRRLLIASLCAVGSVALLALATATLHDGASAQQGSDSIPDCTNANRPGDGTVNTIPVPPTVLLLVGEITVAGAPAPDGLLVEVRLSSGLAGDEPCLGGTFRSGVESNMPSPGRYDISVLAEPAMHANHTISFHFEDGTQADETEIYIDYEDYEFIRDDEGNVIGGEGRLRPSTRWGVAQRILDLNFPRLPVIPENVVPATFYSGLAAAPALLDGLGGQIIRARVGDYVTEPSRIAPNGSFLVAVNPGTENAVGQPVEFFLDGDEDNPALASPPVFFMGTAGTVSGVNLVFSNVDGVTPPMRAPEIPETIQPQVYRGQALSVSNTSGIAGVAIEARIGVIYSSSSVVVGPDGSYVIAVAPPNDVANRVVGETIQFFVTDGEEKAFQEFEFTGLGSSNEVDLVFPSGVGEPPSGGCGVGGSASISNLLLLVVPGLLAFAIRRAGRGS